MFKLMIAVCIEVAGCGGLEQSEMLESVQGWETFEECEASKEQLTSDIVAQILSQQMAFYLQGRIPYIGTISGVSFCSDNGLLPGSIGA